MYNYKNSMNQPIFIKIVFIIKNFIKKCILYKEPFCKKIIFCLKAIFYKKNRLKRKNSKI